MTPPSVRNYLSGVKLLHLMLGFKFPHISSHELKLTLRGIDWLAQHCPLSTPLITPTLLCTLAARGVDFDPVDLTFSCAFFLFARISNLVRESFVTLGVHEHRCICRGDVVPTHYSLCVQFTWSKTIQFGECVLELPLVRIPDSPICPVHLFYLMCEIIPAPQSAPLFVIPSRSGRLRPVLKSQFVLVLRDRLQSAGIPQAHLFRGHSFRRGGTSWAFCCGIPGELIQVFGDWRSDAYKCYLDISLSLRLRVFHGMAFGLSTAKS